MLKSLRLTAAPFVILLVLMSGCSMEQTQATSPSPTPTPSLSTEPAPSPVTSAAPSPSPQTNLFQDASDKAIGAETISESAQSQNDWDLVAGMWQEAIALMKAVPTSSPNYALAQKKVTEYQQNLAYAKQNSQNQPRTVVVNQDSASTTNVSSVSNPSVASSASTGDSSEENLPPEVAQDAQEVIEQFSAVNSRLDVGINYENYSSQVVELKVALDRFARLPEVAKSKIYRSLKTAFLSYDIARSTWKFCINGNYCENDFLVASEGLGPSLIETYNIPTVDKDPSFKGKLQNSAGLNINWKNKIYLNTALSTIWAEAGRDIQAAQGQI